MFKGKFALTLVLITTLVLAGCGGSAVIDTGGNPVSVGDTFTFEGQTFTVTSVAGDGSSITITAPSDGFTQATLTFTLTLSPDGIYRYSTDSLDITYDPTTDVVSWSIAPGTSEAGLIVEVLENELRDAIAAVEESGKRVSDNVDFSYSNINVNGLEDVHNLGWSGETAKVLIIDEHQGDSGIYGYDNGFGAGALDLTHGMNTSLIVSAVAPEAEIIKTELDGYWPISTTDNTIDVVNASFGWHITDSPSLIAGLTTAQDFVVYGLDPLAIASPNAVIVNAAGNNGNITAQSISYNCDTAGDRNTADSCTDVKFSVDEDLYSALDRTIFVGAYDSDIGYLTEYSVSAGDIAKDYFMVADGNSIIDDTMGTSYAAPRVAGVVALTVHKFPNLTAAERTLLVLHTADDLGAVGVDSVFGHGLLNASAALNPVGLLE
ncbi:hypothetical protein A9Q96_05230 [Rhodobacterales bacterium 52_120_T64]|nr:hypothetical protein A9Q96_05230 [Rhodobacterales bacterium 52_120_T64]